MGVRLQPIPGSKHNRQVRLCSGDPSQVPMAPRQPERQQAPQFCSRGKRCAPQLPAGMAASNQRPLGMARYAGNLLGWRAGIEKVMNKLAKLFSLGTNFRRVELR